MDDVLIPFNGTLLALTTEQLNEALVRGQRYEGQLTSYRVPQGHQERIRDAEGMEAETGIPASWFLEQARKGRIPHIRAGKYVRFKLGEVLNHLKGASRPGDRLSAGTRKAANDQ
jgi:glucose-6-phosphate 1-dehydrogenase